MNFEIPLDLVVVLLPPLCLGALLAGVSLFFYMYAVYRNPLYGSILFAGILALVFVGSETMLLYVGSIRLNEKAGRIFHITEQMSGLFYIVGLPFLLEQFVKISPKWKSFNHRLIYASIIISLSIFTAALIKPDLFISLTEHQSTWMTHQENFARGQEGILYKFRDALLGLFLAYCFTMIAWDMIKNKTRGYIVYLAAGLMIAAFGAMIDILYVYFQVYIDFISYSFSRFSLAITLMIAVLMIGAMKDFILSAKKLGIVHQKLVHSENRFRCLFNGTDDVILTSDVNFNLISANTAALKHLGLEKEKLHEKNVLDLFECSKNRENVAFQIMKEKLENFLENSANLSFKSMLLDKFGEHSYEYNMNFEKIELEDRVEIIIHATKTNVKVISEYIENETMRLVMNNQVLNVEEICSRLTINLSKFLQTQQINTIKIGLREMIINAIEHGNLCISFEDKSKLTLSDQYVAYIMNLQKLPEFSDKSITIEYRLEPEFVQYTITDDGDGFDYKNILVKLNEKNSNEMLAHGRGIIMTLNIFDNVLFNEKGNSVTLTKNFMRA